MTASNEPHLKRTLTLPTAVLFGLSYMLPLTCSPPSESSMS